MSSLPRTLRGSIEVKNLEFQARHGATEDEQRSVRRFQVDVSIGADITAAAATDRLSDTVDYHAVCALLEVIGTGRTFHLLEALAGAMLEALLARWPDVSVELTLRKLHPPCPGNPSFTAVKLLHLNLPPRPGQP